MNGTNVKPLNSSGSYECSVSYVIHFINLQWITFSGLLHPSVQIQVPENEVARKVFVPRTYVISEESGMCIAKIYLI
jgi:hypothetical protein